MSARYGSRYRRTSGGGGSRWMNMRYAGTCRVCGKRAPAGKTAFWDAATKQITCYAIECAEADGLTEITGSWAGKPDGIKTRRAFRVGSGYQGDGPNGVVVTTFNSGATTYRNARGRCEDAPCCGCCD